MSPLLRSACLLACLCFVSSSSAADRTPPTDQEKKADALKSLGDEELASEWRALVRTLKWSDSSGKFTVWARYLRRSEDGSTVTLLRAIEKEGRLTEEAKEVDVPVAKLGEAEQKRVLRIAELQAAADAAAVRLAAKEAAALLAEAEAAAREIAPPLAERFLHEGKLAEGETSLALALDADPDDDEARFGLGAIQVALAIENLGCALHKYGANTTDETLPVIGLPVPVNEDPSTISYEDFCRVLDTFLADLTKAEATLAGIKSDDVELRLRLAPISFDFAGTGEDRVSLIAIVTRLNGGRTAFEEASPVFRVHFDRGDVAWLRGYCHLLSAMIEIVRSIDGEPAFEEGARVFFPRVETRPEEAKSEEIRPEEAKSEEIRPEAAKPDALDAMFDIVRSVDGESAFEEGARRLSSRAETPPAETPPAKIRAVAKPDFKPGVTVTDAPRLRRARLHLIAVCDLNRETWSHILKETDDDYEWLPSPKQTDQLGLPITEDQIEAWLTGMDALKTLLNGEETIPTGLVPKELRLLGGGVEGQGLNLKELLDNPPVGFIDAERLANDEPDPRYVGPNEGSGWAVFLLIGRLGQVLNGPFGYAQAARLN